jgi:membrane protease YdiL (CAAX protease family)
MQLKKFQVQKYDLFTFVFITFGIAWGIWIPIAGSSDRPQWLFWMAGFSPTLAAMLLVFKQRRWSGIKHLFTLNVKVPLLWYLISLFGPPALMLLALGLHMLQGGEWPKLLDPNHIITSISELPLILIIFLYIFIFTAIGEEFGWRGFLQPMLQTRFSPFTTSLILGSIWALWHLPLFWIPGDLHQQFPFGWFVLQILGSTFLYTWILRHTRESIILALLFHTASNASFGLLPVLPLDNQGSLQPLWMVVGLLWIIVILLVTMDRNTFFHSADGKSDD